MVLISRRKFFGSAVLGCAGLAGCAAFSQFPEEVPGLQEDRPSRRVPMEWSPQPGTWPHRNYDPGNRRYNPHANPPSESPDVYWEREFNETLNSVIVASGDIFAATTNRLFNLDATDGSKIWSRQRTGTTPKLKYIADRLYETTESKLVARTEDGNVIWTRSLPDTPYDFLERGGYVFVTYPRGYSTLHADSGKRVHKGDLQTRLFAVSHRNIVTTNGLGLLGLEKDRRALHDVWETRFDGPFETIYYPTISEDLCYLPGRKLPGFKGDTDGRVSILSPAGDRITVLKLLHTPVGLAVGENHLLVGTATITAGMRGKAGKLEAFDTSGSPLWTYETNAGVAPLMIGDGTAIVGPVYNDRIPLTALDADTGDVLWRRSVSGPLSLAAVDDVLFVGDGRRLRALR